MKHKGTVRLETERLILRPFTPEDALPMFRNWASDEEVTRFLTWPAHKDVEVTAASSRTGAKAMRRRITISGPSN